MVPLPPPQPTPAGSRSYLSPTVGTGRWGTAPPTQPRHPLLRRLRLPPADFPMAPMVHCSSGNHRQFRHAGSAAPRIPRLRRQRARMLALRLVLRNQHATPPCRYYLLAVGGEDEAQVGATDDAPSSAAGQLSIRQRHSTLFAPPQPASAAHARYRRTHYHSDRNDSSDSCSIQCVV